MAGLASWWPWRRSRPAPSSPAPAPDPGWRAVTPIQRTVGDITATAGLDRFSASLTTAQDPSLVSSAGVLTTGRADTLSILGTGDRPVTPVPPNTAAPQARSWQRSVSLPQRILPAPAAPVQRSADPAVPEITTSPDLPDAVEAAEPGDAVGTSEAFESVEANRIPETPVTVAAALPRTGGPSLTRAPDPGEHREVPVVTPIAAPAISSGDDGTHETAPPAVPPERPVQSSSQVQSAPQVQRTTDVTTTAPSRPSPSPRPAQTVTPAIPVTPTTRPAPDLPPRNSTDDHPVAQRWAAAPEPPTPARPELTAAHPEGDVTHRDEPAETDTDTGQPRAAAPPVRLAAPAPVVAHDVQRAVQPESITWLSPDDPVRLPPTARPSIDGPQTPQSAAVQRVSAQPPTTRPPRIDPPPPPVPSASSPAPAVVAAQRVTHELPAPPSEMHLLQQLSTASLDTPTPAAPGASNAPPGDTPAAHRAHEAPAHPVPTLTAQRSTPSIPPATPAFTVSPLAAPERHTPPTPEPAVPEIQRIASPAAPESTVAPTPRRLVVLPPLRTPDDADAPHPGYPEAVQRFAESPRPMSLQRMFDQAAAPRGPLGHPSAAPDFRPRPSVVEHTGYTEVTFNAPTVQRDAEPGESFTPAEAPAALDTPEIPATPVPAPAPVSAAPAGGDIDELVNRLYDPLAARLRAELWLDRERAGVLMDLR